ncbi:hypothetical protein Syun_024045 [Stephania yunnanensis]|uniref:Protein kinase domain-containing protein n=1 Tax=Stephania yunnanensis TaxID=152371 RepID=A0AAP0FB41_9MAGN
MEKNYNEGEEWEIDPTKLVIKVEDASRGAFGTFHQANYDGRDAAVKLLDWGEEGNRSETEIASLRAAFTQEVAAWCKLDHPNVAKPHEQSLRLAIVYRIPSCYHALIRFELQRSKISSRICNGKDTLAQGSL